MRVVQSPMLIRNWQEKQVLFPAFLRFHDISRAFYLFSTPSAPFSPLAFFSTSFLGTMIMCPQPIHFKRKSAPTRIISHSLLPQGCCFFIINLSPGRTSIISTSVRLFFQYRLLYHFLWSKHNHFSKQSKISMISYFFDIKFYLLHSSISTWNIYPTKKQIHAYYRGSFYQMYNLLLKARIYKTTITEYMYVILGDF